MCTCFEIACCSEIQRQREKINRPICEMMEDANDYKVFKIYYGIDKFMNTESDSDGKGLLIQQILNNQYGQELKSILNIINIQNWFLAEVNYENLSMDTYQNIQKQALVRYIQINAVSLNYKRNKSQNQFMFLQFHHHIIIRHQCK